MNTAKIEYGNAYAVLRPLGFTHADLAQLHRWESTLNRLNENECNGWPTWYNGRMILGWNQEQADKEQAMAERIQARVTRFVESRGLTVNFNGDPRGCAIRLLLPADENGHRVHNSWDGESWVIDW
jgi:hypothetical protein